MSLFSWITKGGNSAEKVIDGIIAGGDKLVLTDEERLDYNKKAADLWLKLQETIGNENTARSLTRRYLAIMVMGVGLSAFVAALVVGFFVDGFTEHTIQVANAFHVGELMLAIGVFYYGMGILGRFNESRSAKK